MARASNPTVRIKTDTRDFERGMGRASSRLDRFSRSGEKSLQRIKLAAAAAGAGLVVIGKNSIDMASDIAEQSSKIETVLGSGASKAIQEFAETSAKSFGISRQEALAASGSFASMFKLIGQSSPAAAQMSIRMTQLAADMASFNNASPEEALTALQAGLRGESEPLRRFNVLLDDATLRVEALERGMIKTTKQALTPQQKAMAAYGVILKQTATQQGDFERTSDGLANQQRILRAEVANMQAELGQQLLPAALKVTTAIRKFVDQIKTGEGAGGRFADAMKDIYNAVRPIAKFFIDHPKLIAIAVAAWATYKTAALATLAATKLGMINVFRGKAAQQAAASAGAAGAMSGGVFARKFTSVIAGMGIAALIANQIRQGINDGGLAQGLEQGSKSLFPLQPGSRGLPKNLDPDKRFIDPKTGKFVPAKNVIKGPPTPAGLSGKPSLGGTNMQKAQQIASIFGLRVTSGYRDPAHNAAVGGVPNSDHMKGTKANPGAVDLVGSPDAMQRAAAYAQSVGIKTLIHDAGSGLHLHLSFPGVSGGAAASTLAAPDFASLATLPDEKGTKKGAKTVAARMTGMDRFGIASEAIGLRETAGVFSASRAAQATIDLTGRALKGAFGKLGVRDRLGVLTQRRDAQETLKERATARSHLAYNRYSRNMEGVDALEAAGRITTGQADARRKGYIAAALAGKYGKLAASDRLLVEKDRREMQTRQDEDRRAAAEDLKQAAQAKAETDRDFMRAYGGTPFTDAALAIAQTDTPGDRSDDRGVLAGRLGLAQSYYAAAKGAGNEDDIVYWAGQVRENTAALTELEETMQEVADNSREQLELTKQALAETQRRLNVAEANSTTIIRGLADVISGEIAGKAGLGMMTPSYSGGGARY